MQMTEEDIVGEGTSSICRRGTNTETGDAVAIKVYKQGTMGRRSTHPDAVNMTKFKRQIEVLQELQEPLMAPSDPKLWHEALARSPPSRLFMTLIDYSTDEHGKPGQDPQDRVMYVVTELAQYSLKGYFKHRREEGRALSKETVKSVAKAIVLVTAGLHAKGLVHLDLKPENLMVFNGCLKLIDVDGCVRIGTTVSITDSSLSFSPCYCAPEWASFLIEDSDEQKIIAHPNLDVWSIGMTLCELILLDAALKPTYASFMGHGRSNREAGFLFMDWLAGLAKFPLPKNIEKFDTDLADMLSNFLLVCDPLTRKSLAETLSHRFIARADLRKSETGPLTVSNDREAGQDMPTEGPPCPRFKRHRLEDTSEKAMHKGTLWKLNTDGDPKEATHWLKRDMWIANNGSLCYFSFKENTRLVLLDANHLAHAKVVPCDGGYKEFAFQVMTKPDHDDHKTEHDVNMFGCDSQAECDIWISTLDEATHATMQTMHLGSRMVQDVKQFKLSVKNRRIKVTQEASHLFEPVFKARLWKVKVDGDRMREADWFEREMWLSKNGSLVYWSKRDEKELVYYTSTDLAHASLLRIDNSESARPWTFQVQLPAQDGIEFAPGEFAAESEETRETWVREFEVFATASAKAPTAG